MTFEELADTLPNGFHDADLSAFQVDYVQRQLTFQLEFWIGDMEVSERREVYRPAIVVVDDVNFVYVEPPRETKEFHIGTSIRIDAGEGIPEAIQDAVQHLHDMGKVTWMFLSELNSFILFSAASASMKWTGPEENRT